MPKKKQAKKSKRATRTGLRDLSDRRLTQDLNRVKALQRENVNALDRSTRSVNRLERIGASPSGQSRTANSRRQAAIREARVLRVSERRILDEQARRKKTTKKRRR